MKMMITSNKEIKIGGQKYGKLVFANGKDSDVVVSSRVRLVRNLAGFKFLNKCSLEEKRKILDTVKEIVPSLGYGLKYLFK